MALSAIQRVNTTRWMSQSCNTTILIVACFNFILWITTVHCHWNYTVTVRAIILYFIRFSNICILEWKSRMATAIVAWWHLRCWCIFIISAFKDLAVFWVYFIYYFVYSGSLVCSLYFIWKCLVFFISHYTSCASFIVVFSKYEWHPESVTIVSGCIYNKTCRKLEQHVVNDCFVTPMNTCHMYFFSYVSLLSTHFVYGLKWSVDIR